METFLRKAQQYKYRRILLIPVLAVVFSFIAIKIIDPVEYANNDFFTFWLSGRLALSGQNPYSAEIWLRGHEQYGATWIPNQTFIYPLPISLFFAPLGLLSLYPAFILWGVLSQFMIVGSTLLLLKSYPPELSKRFLLPFVLGFALFRPTILTLHNGQLTALLLLIIAAAIFFWERGEWWKGSLFLPILALKPNLGIPILVLLSSYLLLRKQFTALFVEIISGVALLVAGLLQNSNWIVEFWKAGNNKLAQMFGFSPTVWGISAFFCRYDRSCTLIYGCGIAFILFVGFALLVKRKHYTLSPALFMGFVITVVLLLTPYTWPYDQLLLLIPIVTITLGLARPEIPFLRIALLPLMIDIMTFILLGVSIILEREFWNVIIPLSIFFLLIWYISTNSLTTLDSQLRQIDK